MKVYRYDNNDEKVYAIVREFSSGLVEISGRLSRGINESGTHVADISLPFNINTYGACAFATIIWKSSHQNSIGAEVLVESNRVRIFSREQLIYESGGGAIYAHCYFSITAYRQ